MLCQVQGGLLPHTDPADLGRQLVRLPQASQKCTHHTADPSTAAANRLVYSFRHPIKSSWELVCGQSHVETAGDKQLRRLSPPDQGAVHLNARARNSNPQNSTICCLYDSGVQLPLVRCDQCQFVCFFEQSVTRGQGAAVTDRPSNCSGAYSTKVAGDMWHDTSRDGHRPHSRCKLSKL